VDSNRKLTSRLFRNSYSISTYRTPLRRILGGDRTLGELSVGPRATLSPVVFAWVVLRQRRRCTLTPRCTTRRSLGNPLLGETSCLFSIGLCIAHAKLVAPSENRFDATTAISAQTRKSAIFFTYNAALPVFPLSGYFCSI